MSNADINLDQIESKVDAFELVQKTCAACFIGALAWSAVNSLVAWQHLASDDATEAVTARLALISYVLLPLPFALTLLVLNTRKAWLMALAGLPLVALVFLGLAGSARPMAYRLLDWSNPANVQIAVAVLLALVTLAVWITVFIRGWLSAATLLAQPESASYRGHHLRTGRGRILDLMFAVPPVVAVMPSRRLTTRSLYIAHAMLCGVIALLPIIWSFGMVLFPKVEQLMHYEKAVLDYGFGPGYSWALFQANVYTGMIAVAVLPVFGWLARRVLAKAQSKIRLSMQDLLVRDARPPVLFLRSFRDDQVRLAPSHNLLSRVLAGSGKDRRLLDHVVTEELSTIGPVVALGAPGDPLPPYGAARGYFEHSGWQDAVRSLMNDAGLIVLVVDDTAGTWWEVERVVERPELLAKTLFLVHPEHAASGKATELVQRVLALLGDGAGAPPIDLSGQNVLGFFVSHRRATWLRSDTFTSRAFGLALRRSSAELVHGLQTGSVAATADHGVPAAGRGGEQRLTLSFAKALTAALLLLPVAGAFAVALAQTSFPAQVLGANIRPWLASGVVLTLLLIVLGVRRPTNLLILVLVWVFAGWLSGHLYHSILQLDEVRWDTFDHHAEVLASFAMLVVFGAALSQVYGLAPARILGIAVLLALAGAGLRLGVNTLSLKLLPPASLSHPVLATVQNFLIVWPGFVLAVFALSRQRASVSASAATASA